MTEPDPQPNGGAVSQVDPLNVPRFAGRRTFARLPGLDDVRAAEIAILGAPFDGGATFRPGARFAPAAIRDASLLIKSFSRTLESRPV